MLLKEVIKKCLCLNKQISSKQLGTEVASVTADTREIQKNALFIALKGHSFDGHHHLEEVLQQGALAVVVEETPTNPLIPYILVKDTKKALAQIAATFYQYPSEDIKMIGVTGTNGKTTTTHLIDEIIQYCGASCGVIGTMYNKIGTEKIPTVNTTPDSLTLQKIFARIRAEKIPFCAMEVSSHALQLGRTWGTDFDVAVFTNLTQDHLDFHETMNDYFLAKSLLFSQLGNTYAYKNKTAVVNIDDPWGAKLLPLTSSNILTYSCHETSDLQAKNIAIQDKSSTFTLAYLGEEYPVETKLIGEFNIYNILGAIGACLACGYPIKDILKAIPHLRGVKGRFEVVPTPQRITAIVDYAHTPDGLENVLETIQKIATKNIYCVVGCGGDRDKTKRPQMAAVATKYSTEAIFTSDNPRNENPESILKDMTNGLAASNFKVEVDRRKAIALALSLANEGDVLLVAGKGHEDYQIIGTEKSHFDDYEEIQKAANKLAEK